MLHRASRDGVEGGAVFWGADTEQLRGQAEACRSARGRLAEMCSALDTMVASVEWVGTDVEDFRSDFGSRVSMPWKQLESLLDSDVTELAAHADEQDVVSAARSGERGGQGRDLDDGARRTDPRTGRRPHDAQQQEPGSPEFGTSGPDPYPSGLGPGQEGTAVEVPDPPVWIPPDEGSGEYDQRDPGFEDYANYELAELIATGGDLTGKEPAAENMRHFLGNSGDDMPIDVDDMMTSAPQLAAEIEATRQQMGQQAIADAQQSGATGPVTFPINTDWSGYYISESESAEYFYATGGMQYNVNGSVTAHPPSTPGGEWTYEMNTEVNTRDRYNWDSGKSVTIGPVQVDDEQMQGLHQSGLAQEYNIVGQSSRQTTTGP